MTLEPGLCSLSAAGDDAKVGDAFLNAVAGARYACLTGGEHTVTVLRVRVVHS